MKRMKSTIQIFALLCVVGLFAFSCSSDDDNNSGPQYTEGAITFKMDGAKFSTIPMVTYAMMDEGVIYLSGVTGDDVARTISISLNGSELGTYKIGGDYVNSGILFETTEDENNPEGGSMEIWAAPFGDGLNGEVTVTKITSTHVEGTFNFQAKNTTGDQSVRNLTDGAFNVKILSY